MKQKFSPRKILQNPFVNKGKNTEYRRLLTVLKKRVLAPAQWLVQKQEKKSFTHPITELMAALNQWEAQGASYKLRNVFTFHKVHKIVLKLLTVSDYEHSFLKD